MALVAVPYVLLGTSMKMALALAAELGLDEPWSSTPRIVITVEEPDEEVPLEWGWTTAIGARHGHSFE